MRMEEPRRWKSVGRVVVNSGFGWVGIKRGKGYLGGICSRTSQLCSKRDFPAVFLQSPIRFPLDGAD